MKRKSEEEKVFYVVGMRNPSLILGEMVDLFIFEDGYLAREKKAILEKEHPEREIGLISGFTKQELDKFIQDKQVMNSFFKYILDHERKVKKKIIL